MYIKKKYLKAGLMLNTLGCFTLWSVSGSFAGGQRITVSGTGLYDDVTVTVCDVACPVSSSPYTTSLVCDTPAHSGTYNSLLSCLNENYVVDTARYCECS